MKPQKKSGKHYNYLDYSAWPDKERWEIIDGIPYAMSPSPSLQHQRITGALFRKLSNHLVGKSCEAFIAPLDVLLPGENIPVETVETVVQPDVFVVCDPCKKTAQCILGAPDFIAEIVSPSSGSMDKVEKLNLYERTGVAEYWILDSDDATLMVFKLGTEGKYVRPETYGAYHAYSLHYMPIDMFPG